jgi:hypothetical protein
MEVLPDKELKLEPYLEEHRTVWATHKNVRRSLNPPWKKPASFSQRQYKDLVAKARAYYLEGGKLYKRSVRKRHLSALFLAFNLCTYLGSNPQLDHVTLVPCLPSPSPLFVFMVRVPL